MNIDLDDFPAPRVSSRVSTHQTQPYKDRSSHCTIVKLVLLHDSPQGAFDASYTPWPVGDTGGTGIDSAEFAIIPDAQSQVWLYDERQLMLHREITVVNKYPPHRSWCHAFSHSSCLFCSACGNAGKYENVYPIPGLNVRNVCRPPGKLFTISESCWSRGSLWEFTNAMGNYQEPRAQAIPLGAFWGVNQYSYWYTSGGLRVLG